MKFWGEEEIPYSDFPDWAWNVAGVALAFLVVGVLLALIWALGGFR